MLRTLRRTMQVDPAPLAGVVEVDETYVGGKGYNRGRQWWTNWTERPKEILIGMVERGGRVKTEHVPNTGVQTLTRQVVKHIAPGSTIFSDQNPSYFNLPRHGYTHDYINHSKHFVRGHVHSQNIENFWSHLKCGIKGVGKPSWAARPPRGLFVWKMTKTLTFGKHCYGLFLLTELYLLLEFSCSITLR